MLQPSSLARSWLTLSLACAGLGAGCGLDTAGTAADVGYTGSVHTGAGASGGVGGESFTTSASTSKTTGSTSSTGLGGSGGAGGAGGTGGLGGTGGAGGTGGTTTIGTGGTGGTTTIGTGGAGGTGGTTTIGTGGTGGTTTVGTGGTGGASTTTSGTGGTGGASTTTSGTGGAGGASTTTTIDPTCEESAKSITLGVGLTTAPGTTAGDSALTPTKCNAGSGPEVVYAVTPTEAGTLTVTLDSAKAKVLYVRESACAGTELACTTGKPATVELLVEAGKTYYVVVDGEKAGDAGNFTLVLTLSQCGNGTIDADEECDDANLVAGDTCDNKCKVVCSGNGTTKRPAPWNTCYRYVDSQKNWNEAQAVCVAWGGNLVSIADAAEQAFVKPLNNGKDVWIGAKGGEKVFAWVDGTPWWNPGNWSGGQPDDFGWTEDCVEMYDNGKWNDVACWSTYRFICERPPAGKMP